MEYLIDLPQDIKRILGVFTNMIDRLNRDAKHVEEMGDFEELIKIGYNINLLKDMYAELRGEHDPYYAKSIKFKAVLNKAIQEDDMHTVMDIAKQMGHKQTDICRLCKVNSGNLSSYLKGKKNTLSVEKRNLIYKRVWTLCV